MSSLRRDRRPSSSGHCSSRCLFRSSRVLRLPLAAESEPSPAPPAPKPALVPPPPFVSHEGDPQLERSLARRDDRSAAGGALRGALDIVLHVPEQRPARATRPAESTPWVARSTSTVSTKFGPSRSTAAQPFGDNQLALFAANIDTDGNLTNHCAGVEYSVAVGWVSGAGLVARLFSWVNGCNDPGTGEPLSVRRLAGNEVDVSWVDGSIGSPTTFHWYDDVTGATNADGKPVRLPTEQRLLHGDEDLERGVLLAERAEHRRRLHPDRAGRLQR